MGNWVLTIEGTGCHHNGKPEIDRYMKTTKTIPSLVYDPATGQVIVTGGAEAKTFQPMNVNFGLFPPIAQVPTRGPDGKSWVATEERDTVPAAMRATSR